MIVTHDKATIEKDSQVNSTSLNTYSAIQEEIFHNLSRAYQDIDITHVLFLNNKYLSSKDQSFVSNL